MSETRNSSKVQVRAKIQELIMDNTRSAIGRFHAKELNERGLVDDLIKHFDIKPRKN